MSNKNHQGLRETFVSMAPRKERIENLILLLRGSAEDTKGFHNVYHLFTEVTGQMLNLPPLLRESRTFLVPGPNEAVWLKHLALAIRTGIGAGAPLLRMIRRENREAFEVAFPNHKVTVMTGLVSDPDIQRQFHQMFDVVALWWDVPLIKNGYDF